MRLGSRAVEPGQHRRCLHVAGWIHIAGWIHATGWVPIGGWVCVTGWVPIGGWGRGGARRIHIDDGRPDGAPGVLDARGDLPDVASGDDDSGFPPEPIDAASENGSGPADTDGAIASDAAPTVDATVDDADIADSAVDVAVDAAATVDAAGDGAAVADGAVDAKTCTSGETLCEDTCTKLMTDHEHCGFCTKACDADEICTSGSCAPFGYPGSLLCRLGPGRDDQRVGRHTVAALEALLLNGPPYAKRCDVSHELRLQRTLRLHRKGQLQE